MNLVMLANQWWMFSFSDKYDFVGRLLKPGEEPTSYSDDEDGEQTDEPQQSASTATTDKKDDWILFWQRSILLNV